MRVTLLIIAATLSLAGCKPPTPSYTVTDPKTGEKTKISVDDKAGDKSITVKTNEGNSKISIAEKGEAPRNLPAYIPLYPGATYSVSVAASSDKSTQGDAVSGGPVSGGMASFSTPDPSAKVLAFYKDAFVRAGLKEQASGDMGGMSMISFTKGDNEQNGAQVMASPAPSGGTEVQVIYSAVP